jgi:hypothetical protein
LEYQGNLKSKLFGLENVENLNSLNFESSEFPYQSPFDPSQFFIPGWKGEGLITASGLTIKSALNNLTIDASQLLKKLQSTPSMRKQVFDEFILYSDSIKLNDGAFNTPSDFFFHLQDDTSPYKDNIQEFIKIYSFRAVAIYLFRIKFILDLAREIRLEVGEDTLFNPLSFLGKIFKKASSTELVCESLQINQYSWYRPSLEYRETLQKISEAFVNVTITELIKLLSTTNNQVIYSVKNYSHSLSHMSWGLFINNLLIQFPKWIEKEDKDLPSNFLKQKTCLIPKTVSTQFEGIHVSSLALSHWLAQESSMKNSHWDHLICPEFKGKEFLDGTFLKIVQELQFLSFLTKMAVEHHYEVVPFICKIMKDKARSNQDDTIEQISFLNLTELGHEARFGRKILNLTDGPKTNPHHHLVNQILGQKNSLKKDGILYVMSNQKLFVPSHSERVDQLLKEYKLIALFDLDELKGKGEIPHFIYILTPRNDLGPIKNHLFTTPRHEKESCSSFKIKGDLSRFNKFHKIVEEFEFFLKNKKSSNTPIYVNDIIEGKLVSSHSDRMNARATHPSFFKNLTKSSVSLETFFAIEHLDPSGQRPRNNLASELLGLKLNALEEHPLLLIVNQSNPMQVEIELAPFDSYKAKIEQFGTAFFSYFGLKPKHAQINLNVFREYFNSAIGMQIMALQLSDGPTKIKGKLKSLLIPAFFIQTHLMPPKEFTSFTLLEREPKDLLKLHPDEINHYFTHIEECATPVKKKYPWHLLSLLSHFKSNLKMSIEGSEGEEQFSNPLVTNELLGLKNYNVYPRHKDIYIEIETNAPSDLQLPLSMVQINTKDDNYYLTLKSGDKKIISIYSSQNMIQFMKYILQNAAGVKISEIMLGLRMPLIDDLDSTLSKFKMVKDNKQILLSRTNNLIEQIFIEQISAL